MNTIRAEELTTAELFDLIKSEIETLLVLANIYKDRIKGGST